MEIAKLILEYAKVIIWPLVVLVMVIKYGKHLHRLLERVAEESEEISSGFLGLTARFRQQISEARTQDMDKPALLSLLRQQANNLARDEFRLLCARFFSAPLRMRGEAAAQVAAIAPDLTVEDLLEFARSPLAGERVGAAIGIRVKVLSSPGLADDQRVVDTVKALLHDPESRVRYRAVEAVGATPRLISAFADDLRYLMSSDQNVPVRKAAIDALQARDKQE